MTVCHIFDGVNNKCQHQFTPINHANKVKTEKQLVHQTTPILLKKMPQSFLFILSKP